MTRKQFFLVFMIPTFIILFFLAFYPLLNAFYYSLQNWDLRSSRPIRFVGLKNYIQLFTDARFLNSLRISLLWSVITVGFSVFFGAGLLAPLINDNAKGSFRTLCLFIFIIPALLPRVGAAYMWRLMYSSSIGIINYFLSFLRIGPIGFLENPSYALYSVAAIDIWQWSFLIAALTIILLQDIPKEIVEAGSLDGAKRWQLYRFIIFPVIIPPFLSIFFIKMMESLRSFDFIFVLTAGGPGIATETLDMYAYWQGIGSAGRVSYASSMSIVMLVITIVLITIVWRGLVRWHD
ncbi:MAG TPA: sugar ABC transporter permease [Atribacter sp.]|uniref:Lactose transport system permease protein LacF n=1 Tax=Candidatus Atribacter allofermentans TaxID=1852833 RepID=A0A1V5SJL1_9BACT|nr:sugar ABC transporter permease [Atribacter sp.]MDD3713890.1 sugar ABC transporter permease [Atribacterota bacterium]OQA54730.1 MAG: Lactose transport system permease protein LacF [Candidatus Atribacteria bacterium ADurb.Bin276]HHT10730.1 sugar ABC transporter permease [Candidatus Atribacteria bacterium]MDI9595536.1 sugar ABC transporter permease [Atribacterota bacterium]HQK83468.1 sugar ABC transporter permease [Atribacter sp.]